MKLEFFNSKTCGEFETIPDLLQALNMLCEVQGISAYVCESDLEGFKKGDLYTVHDENGEEIAYFEI